ncbi:MAG: APC family permease [Bacillota bacterium]
MFALAFGAMIGWGWVVLTGCWLEIGGSLGSIVAFIIGGLMILAISLTYAELTSTFPENGGITIFTEKGLGEKASFISTWAIILGYISVVAFETVAFPSVIQHLFEIENFGTKLYQINGYNVESIWLLLGVSSSIVITLVNYFGGKNLAAIQSLVTVFIVIAGLSLITGGIVKGDYSNAKPLFLNGAKGILSVAIMTPFMFLGFDVIPQAASEMNVESKKIGSLLVLSVVMALLWYIGIIFATSLTLNQNEIISSNLVTADAIYRVFNGSKIASKLLIIAGIGGIITSWNSFFIGGSRAIQALAKKKQLPKFLAKTHTKYKTPSNAILLVGGISTLAPLLGKPMLTWLVNSGSITVIFAYLMVALSFLSLRKNRPNLERPYKIKYPKLIGYTAVLMTSLLILMALPGFPSALSFIEWSIVIGWFIFGYCFYFSQRHNFFNFQINLKD